MRSFLALTERGRARRLRNLALNALQLYDIDVVNLRLITNGCNGIFRIDTRTGEKWVIRVTLPEGGHTRDHVTAEMDWLTALAHDTQLSVPHPLAARDGSYVVETSAEGVPEARLCEVFSWVPGTDLANHMTPGYMAQLGELSAYLHAHASTYQPPVGVNLLKFDRVFPFPEPVILFETEYEDSFTAEQHVIFRKALVWAQKAIDLLKDRGEPMRIIHGDLHQWNVRCAHDKLSPIDFEDLMWGWPVQDIATTLYYFQDEDNYHEMRTAFEEGYHRISPLPERYSGEIDAFIAARGLGMLNFVLQNNNLMRIDLDFFVERIEKRLTHLMMENSI
jgi:Ser/Thr protein kinase RdoA (MazF antagonist)